MIGAPLLRFSLVGVANSAIGLLSIWVMMYLIGTDYPLANLAGYLIGACFGFAANRFWTFADRSPWVGGAARWAIICLLSYLINIALVTALVSTAQVGEYLAQAAGVFAYAILTFSGCRFFVFSQQSSCQGAHR